MKTADIIALITLSPAGFCAAQDAEKESAPMAPEMAAVAANDRACSC